jgi:diguanylate cyclase (GGDEF)-like protein/PAS domain S-box-containing protein
LDRIRSSFVRHRRANRQDSTDFDAQMPLPSTTGSSHTQPHTPQRPAVPELRAMLGRERRCSPAFLIIAACAAIAAQAAGPAAWVWFAAYAATVGARVLLANRVESSDPPTVVASPSGIAYLGTHVAEVALWALLFGAVSTPAQLLPAGAGFAAAGSVLLTALTLGGWRPLWLPLLAGWVGVAAWILWRADVAAQPMVLLFPLWLGAVWWLASRRSRGASARPARTTMTARTRLGWSTAIGAMPTPLLIVRHGRIADVNAAAAQCFARDELALIGRRIEDCLRVDPPESLDPMRAPRDSQAVTLTPTLANADPTPWTARVRVLEPGQSGSVLVIALVRHAAAAAVDGVAAEAGRFAAGVGGANARPWYRDEAGRLIVPSGLPLAPAAYVEREFPLAYCVVPEERPHVNEAWVAALDQGAPFDERVTIVDVRGALRAVRVVAVRRAAAGRQAPAIVGAIAPARSGQGAADAGLAELARRLPVLLWLVDATGRVIYAHGQDAWRWGMQRSPEERPLWFDAFQLRNGARIDVQTALQKALAGRPTYDLINSRTTRSGGRIVLRSHFVPYQGLAPAGLARAGTLVLDTIAAPDQLAEIDRLRRSKAQYRALVEASTSLIWACDAQFRFTFVSRRAAREIYGYEPGELIGESLAKLFAAGAEQTAARQTLAKLRVGQTLRNVEMVHASKNGSRLVISLSAVPMKASDGGFGGAIGMNADLTVLKLRERRLTEALRIERTVLDSAGQALAVVKDGLVARCNDAFLHLLQAEPALLARSPLADYFATVDEWTAITTAADAARAQDRAATREVQIRRGSRAGGQATAWCQLTARAIAPGEYVVVLANIDHIRQREEEALHDAHHDDLTGLPNRRLLATRAASAFAATALRNARCALFAIDLDGFKEINDRYGHDIGDRVLREIAARLARAMRPQDTVARRGGDEFAVLVPDAGHQVDTERIAQRLLGAIAQPVETAPGHVTSVSASVGIALAPDHGRDLERLLQLADLAMYDAKLRGKNRYAFAAEAGGVLSPAAPRAALAS